MSIQAYFDELITLALGRLSVDEVLLASFSGEDSDFVRVNGGLVRQAGSVRQRSLSLDLIAGGSHAQGTIQLAQQIDIDLARVESLVGRLREQRQVIPVDPYLSYATEIASTERIVQSDLPQADEIIGELGAASANSGGDLVGIYASGETFRGFANSLGQRNWHQAATFNLDWSQYLRADKAVKSGYAGRNWDSSQFATKVSDAAKRLEALARSPIDLKPGRYRSYLAPAAVGSMVDMLAWGGFSLKAARTKQTPLLKMVAEGATLSPKVTVTEATGDGYGPNFQSEGFLRPEEVVLINNGSYGESLVSPRSAVEYGVTTNGASEWEEPEAVAIAPGSMPESDVLTELGTGLYVANLWYLNFSDRAACRTTGMTRFATFWVEGGEIVAPVNVMRFDDTAYNMLGTNLVGLTDTTETILDPSTYHQRSTGSYELPGALIEDLTFTL